MAPDRKITVYKFAYNGGFRSFCCRLEEHGWTILSQDMIQKEVYCSHVDKLNPNSTFTKITKEEYNKDE